MSKIDEIFQIFRDEKYHSIEEIAKEFSLPKFKVRKILGFLKEFNFIEFDRKNGLAKLTPQGKSFYNSQRPVVES